jgi:RNA polymerase sigma-70 factor (ECF subfamily)
MSDWPTIISAHESTLWRTAFRILNHRDDALDCCQEALLDAYEYSLTHKVDRWGAILTSMVTRRAIDRLRKRIRARWTALPLDDVVEPAVEADCPGPLAEASELMDRLRHGLVDLPEKQAEVFWLNCIEGWSHEDIGRQLQISPNESRVLLHRARSHLASILDAPHFGAKRST